MKHGRYSKFNPYKDVKEKDWQAQVLEALKLHGWVVAHFRTGMTQSGGWSTAVAGDGAGFPDLIALHPAKGWAFVAELKTETGKLTGEQAQWLAWFEAVGWDAFVWRPSDVDEMLEVVSAQATVPEAARRRGP